MISRHTGKQSPVSPGVAKCLQVWPLVATSPASPAQCLFPKCDPVGKDGRASGRKYLLCRKGPKGTLVLLDTLTVKVFLIYFLRKTETRENGPLQPPLQQGGRGYLSHVFRDSPEWFSGGWRWEEMVGTVSKRPSLFGSQLRLYSEGIDPEPAVDGPPHQEA